MGVDVTALFQWEADPDDDFSHVEEIERRGDKLRKADRATRAARMSIAVGE
jgi:hypothetical protein